MAIMAVPTVAHIVSAPDLCVVRYFQRTGGNTPSALESLEAHAPQATFRLLNLCVFIALGESAYLAMVRAIVTVLMCAGTLDLVSCLYPDKPSMASTAVPTAAHFVSAPNLCVVRYFQRTAGTASTALASLQAHAPLAMFRLLDLDHPTLQLPASIVGAVHTSPLDCHVQEINGEAVQLLPHAVPYLQGQQLHAYMLATDSSRVLRGVPGKDKQGRLLMADMLRYSRVQHAVLVFLALVEV
jgi:hypothetical protein